MHLRRPLTIPFLVVLLVVLLAGCGAGGGGGGGGQQSGNDAQDGGTADEAKKQKGGDAAKKKKLKSKVALGEITKVIGEQNRVVVLKPSREIEGSKQLLVLRIRKKAEVTLAGQEAELADIEAGQQAQIEYVRKEGRNRARSLTLFKAGETSTSEGG